MDRSSYGFYSKSSETLDNNQKNTQEDNKNLIKTQYPVIKTEKGVNPANTHQVQHVPAQQLLTNQNKTQTHDQDKNLNVKNSTTITLIENGHGDVNGDKDKKYITLEPKTEINDDNKNTITITPSLPKQQVVNNNSIDRKKETKLVKRPLQCLETLAEKAGITFEDKYEAANTLLALEKQNNFKKHTEQNQHKIGANGLEEIDTKYSQIHRHIKQQQELHEQLLKIHQLHQEHLVAQQQILQRQQQQFQKDAVNLQQQGQQQQFQQQQQQHQQQQQQQLQDSALRHQQRSEQPVLQQQLSSQQQQVQQQQLPQQQVHLQHRPPEKVSQVEATLHTAEHKYTPVSISQHQNTQLFNLPGIGEVNLSYIQHNVGLSFDKGLKNMSQDIKPQQIVEGQQGQVVHTGMSMSQQHDNQQHHQTVTVVSSMPNNMHQVQQQQQQQQQAVSNMQQQQQNNGITTMPPIQSLQPNSQHQQQLSTEWGHGRVQVIQQPLQNNAYLQQLYNAQGPLLMPGNLALHPSINSQQIQVIAAGKPFQGNQLAPHMITTQGKQVLQGQPVGTNPFPGYTTIPANPTTQNPTFVFSPLGVISSQPNILPSHSQSTVTISQQQKNNEMHKVLSSGKVAHKLSSGQQVPVGAQCVQVSQQPAQAQIISPLPTGGQTMQFAPWQISGAIPQVWTGGLQAGTLQGGGLLAPNPIFIRGTQPDAQTSMFIQHSPQNIQQNNTNVGCATGVSKPRPSADMSKSRPLSNILPSSGIRPASSVSTQTTANQAQSQAKQRGKPSVRSPAPATKQDAANQTNKMQHQMQQPKQQLVVMNSNGQMTQITSIQDKQALAKNVQQQQQQAIFQQQLMQQQQQQMLQQQSQQQQIVQQYQQGMALNMQQGTMPVGSVAQNISMATGMPQTISMVQHIHPLSGMTQQGTLVGQITNSNNQSQQPTMAQIQSMQQHQQHQQQQHQHQQTLLQGGMVQTSVGMSTQQPIMTHTTSMQTTLQTTLDDSSIIPTSLLQVPTVIQEVQSTTMGQGQIGVQHGMITTPMMPLVHVKSEEDKQSQSQTQQTAPIVQQIAPQPAIVSSAPQTSMPPPAAPTTSVSHVANSEPAVSTTVEPPKPSLLVPKPEVSVATQQAAVNALATSAASTIVPASTSVQTSIVTSQVVTTTAALSQPSVTSLMSTTVSTNGLFKSPSCTPKHFPQSSMQDKTLPKAMVKPNILTHVIEGYVIQEAAEPFAVNRPIREWDKDDKENKLPSADEPPRKKQHIDSPSPRNESPTTTTPTKSENENSTADAAAKIPNACKWTVSEVCDFIRNIPGCAAYADEFFMQEVDGEALLLIRPQHLVMALNMKLGPALKIVACIDALRPENEQQSQNNVD